ncbi:MAG: hypothetical protein RLP15_12960 [Cryomorphaceae bacterium]
MKTDSLIQRRVFEELKKQTPKGENLVDSLADLLEISTDSVYRRMRGDTDLTAKELESISLNYDVSIDEFLDGSNKRVSFNFQPINEEGFTFTDYLGYIKNMMRLVYEGKSRKMLYIANDIPFFHLLSAPTIAAFKLFFWQKTILDYRDFKYQKFELNVRDEAINELSRRTRQYYLGIPSIEIYSPETINTTLKQIYYYFESGLFDKPTLALVLLDDLEQLVDHLRAQCEQGYKFAPNKERNVPEPADVPYETEGNYTVYHNEVLFTDATILVELDDQRWSYLTNNGLNVLSTRDERFYYDNLKSFEILTKRSTRISGSSEKERSKVFNNYQVAISQMRKRIEIAMQLGL